MAEQKETKMVAGSAAAGPGVTGRLSPRALLILIVLLAAALRLAAALTRPMIQLDETIYARMAENIATGNGLVDLTGVTTVHFSPLFPAIVAAVSFLTRNYIVAGYIVVVVFGSLIAVPTYLLGRELVGERVGLMAAALLAVLPLFIDHSSRLYGESVYAFFLLFALWFIWLMFRDLRLKYAFAAAVLLEISYLSNPSAVYYLLMVPALAIVIAILRKKRIGELARPVGLFLAVFLVLAMPYLIFLRDTTGKWTYTGKNTSSEVAFAVNNNLRYGSVEWEKAAGTLTDDGREAWEVRAETSEDLASFFVHNPRLALKMFATESNVLYSEILPKVIPLWTLLLLGLGLFARDWDRRRAVAVGFIFLVTSPALIVVAMYATDRFFIPFVPPALILMGVGWKRLEEWAGQTVDLSLAEPSRPRWRRVVPWAVAIAVLAPVAVFGISGVVKTSYDTQYREAGEWIKSQTGGGAHVMARWESSSAYYSGGIAVNLPYADYDRINGFARSKGVDYLVLSRSVINDIRPELKRLLDEDQASHPEWRLVKTIRPGTDQETLIFQYVK